VVAISRTTSAESSSTVEGARVPAAVDDEVHTLLAPALVEGFSAEAFTRRVKSKFSIYLSQKNVQALIFQPSVQRIILRSLHAPFAAGNSREL
jgi:hypothetical protein